MALGLVIDVIISISPLREKATANLSACVRSLGRPLYRFNVRIGGISAGLEQRIMLRWITFPIHVSWYDPTAKRSHQ